MKRFLSLPKGGNELQDGDCACFEANHERNSRTTNNTMKDSVKYYAILRAVIVVSVHDAAFKLKSKLCVICESLQLHNKSRYELKLFGWSRPRHLLIQIVSSAIVKVLAINEE